MDAKPRCQSCGMPLRVETEGKAVEGFYGTNADGTENQDWCKICFAGGAFTSPDLTVDQMVQRSIDFMTGNLGMPVEQASAMSNDVIRKLRRWAR